MSVFLQFLRQFNGPAEIPSETVSQQTSEASSEFQQMLFEMMTTNEQFEGVPSDMVKRPSGNATKQISNTENLEIRVDDILLQTEGETNATVKTVQHSAEQNVDTQIQISGKESTAVQSFAQSIVPIQQFSENTNVSFQAKHSPTPQQSVATTPELPIISRATSIVLPEYSQQQENVPTTENKEVFTNNKQVENISTPIKQHVQQHFFGTTSDNTNNTITQTVVENASIDFQQVENVNFQPKEKIADIPTPASENKNVRFVQQPTREHTQIIQDDKHQQFTFVASKEILQNLTLETQAKTSTKDTPKFSVHQNIAKNVSEQPSNVTIENIVHQNEVDTDFSLPKEIKTLAQLFDKEKPALSKKSDVLTELRKLETNKVDTSSFVKESSAQHTSTIFMQSQAAILKETVENVLPKKSAIANRKQNEITVDRTKLNTNGNSEIKLSETIQPVETKFVNESKTVSENIPKNFEQKKIADSNVATSLNIENATEKQLSPTLNTTVVEEQISLGKETTQQKQPLQQFTRNDAIETSNRMQDVGTQRNEIQSRYSNALSNEWAKQVIEDVSKSAMFKVTEQLSEIRLRLHPEHLGELVLSVKSDGEKMSANILVNSFEVKRALETNLSVLHDALLIRGIEMKKIDVNENTNAQQQFRHNDDSQTEQQNRQQSRPYDEERAKQFARYFGYNTMEYTV